MGRFRGVKHVVPVARRQRTKWVTSKEMRDLAKSNCCLNSKLLLHEISERVKIESELRSFIDVLKTKIRNLTSVKRVRL